jgi:hypothetical protein
LKNWLLKLKERKNRKSRKTMATITTWKMRWEKLISSKC